MSSMAKKAVNGWRPKRNGCEFTVIPDEICCPGGPQLSDISKRRESIAALMEEHGESLTDGETKRRLKICLRSGQEAQESESHGKRREGAGRTNAATSRG